MNQLPLRCRVIGAMELQPMTIPQISLCLDARPAYVQRVVSDLRSVGAARCAGSRHRRTGRPEKVWELVA